ncbi:hypothetical protein [Halomicronema hongdechloris]|uniref:hypothetical protein n=1 Tax=Halomicronema hongdechloris TaxID=1209493 RepID=UPI0016515E94|nr:hypothetical protein [Halomicronema hongdechloris]
MLDFSGHAIAPPLSLVWHHRLRGDGYPASGADAPISPCQYCLPISIDGQGK